MSKHTSRLNRIEENLNINEEEDGGMPIVGWHLPKDTNYFRDEREKSSYQKWRMATIKKEYRYKGLQIPIMAYCFDEEDVQKHIEEFRTYEKSTDSLKNIDTTKMMEFDAAFFKKGGNKAVEN